MICNCLKIVHCNCASYWWLLCIFSVKKTNDYATKVLPLYYLLGKILVWIKLSLSLTLFSPYGLPPPLGSHDQCPMSDWTTNFAFLKQILRSCRSSKICRYFRYLTTPGPEIESMKRTTWKARFVQIQCNISRKTTVNIGFNGIKAEDIFCDLPSHGANSKEFH